MGEEKTVQRKFYKPITTVFITIGLFFVAQFLASFAFIFIALGAGWNDAQLQDWINSNSVAQFIFVIVADSLILGGVWYFLKKRRFLFSDIGLALPKLSDAGRAILAYVVYIVLFIIITVIAKMIAPSLDLEQEQQIGFEAGKSAVNLAIAGISLVVLPPIVEEILSRGFMYTGLRKYMKVTPSAIIVSIFFAAAHLQFGSGAPLLWVAAIDTFVLSLVLVYLRETTGKLAAPMLLHGMKNAVAFSLLFIFV